MSDREEYLGDGLYASFDGYQFKLRAPRGAHGDHEVYLEPEVFDAFVAFAKRITEAANERAYEREQERLMEGGGAPTLLEQQIAAMKLK